MTDVQYKNENWNKSRTEKGKQETLVEHARHIFPSNAIIKLIIVIWFTTIGIRMTFGVEF
uniref:Uncharacterized protein n=1 Tax=Magallana gigas TaxID=29159 RepID=K1PIR1_MAGGI